jgi:hypothetical protein
MMQSTDTPASTSNSETQQDIYNDTASVGRYAKIHTIDQAKQEVYELFDEQLKKALAERSPPNQSTYGDSRAKEAFWMILAPEEQRDVFINFWKRSEFWPRIKTLVGIPPFSFLKPGDNSILNASGIASNRTNMSHPSNSPILSCSEIGTGHVSDEYGRLYKLLKTDNRASTNVVFRRIKSSGKLAMDCRLPRMANTDRVAIHKRRSRDPDAVQKITFPRIGEELKLQLVNVLSDNPGDKETYRIVVKGVVPRDKGSPVCRVFAETRL